MNKEEEKKRFLDFLKRLASSLSEYISTEDGQWTVKGFIDIYRNIYTISADTKIVSKILELHLFPRISEFAVENGFVLELASFQNYYPDLTFRKADSPEVLFAVDLKTTFRRSSERPGYCNGFTLGSHGEYFVDRMSRKNIQHPYSEYLGHFCLGVIYDRLGGGILSEVRKGALEQLGGISSVAGNFLFFAEEKWRIASDRSGSGNTANIGSVKEISSILNGSGPFSQYGEELFDDYWSNYGKILFRGPDGNMRRITCLEDFLKYRGMEEK